MGLHPDLKEFVALLNAHRVEYLVVGAHALAFHAKPRFTGDLDVLVRSTMENAERVVKVLTELGFGDTGVGPADFLSENQVIQLGVSPNRIDLLTALTGVSFEEAWRNKVVRELDGIEVFIIGKEELIRNKRALGREQDLADLKDLGV